VEEPAGGRVEKQEPPTNVRCWLVVPNLAEWIANDFERDEVLCNCHLHNGLYHTLSAARIDFEIPNRKGRFLYPMHI
jgi:hypothetical protein